MLRSCLVPLLVLTMACSSVRAVAPIPPRPVAAVPGTAEVRGVLLDQQGLPAANYQVGLKSHAGDLFMSGPTAADGSFLVIGLPPETYHLVAVAPDGTEFPVLSREVPLKAGQSERVELRLSGTGTAPGRAPAPAGSAPTGGTATKAGGSKGFFASTGAKVAVAVVGLFAVGSLLSGDSASPPPPASPSTP